MADLKQQLAEANAAFEEADEKLRDINEELEADEGEVGEAFRLRKELLEARDTACSQVRSLIKQTQTKIGKFRIQKRNKKFLDADGTIELAQELGTYEKWVELGIIQTVVDMKKAEEHLDEQTHAKLMEKALTTITTGVAIYGPKPGDIK